MRFLPCVLALLLLAGCDKLSGAADQKIADAEAIGFACRISSKAPAECIQENDAYSPSNILDGWKLADEDISAGKIDPSMRNRPAAELQSETPALVEDKPAEGEAAVEAAPAEPAASPAADGSQAKEAK